MLRTVSSILVVTFVAFWGAFAVTTEENRIDDEQRQALWEDVRQAEKKSLPQTVLKKLDKIYTLSIADGDYPAAAHALAKKYVVEGSVNQPSTTFVIRKLQTDITDMPAEVQPVMKTILANWFYTYYQQNRWRFAQRSQTTAPPSDDFETWDLKRILNEVDRLFCDALASSVELKKVPIKKFDGLIHKGGVDDAHRPTLFDFIAFQALEFYALDEQIIRRQDAFTITADGPMFASTDGFLAWQPDTIDAHSFLLNAIGLYQDLLRFHADDVDPTARLDADLHRLRFGYLVAAGSEKSDRYKAALQRFSDRAVDHPLSSLALSSLAVMWQEQDHPAKAHDVASQGYARHPDSPGGKRCYNAIQQIEAQQMNVVTERVWNASSQAINVKYRNCQSIHFRLVAFDYRNWRWGDRGAPEQLDRRGRERILRQKPIASWSHDLPATPDYQERSQSIPVDPQVKSGCYLLLASVRSDFADKENIISIAEVWVSNIAVVMRSDNRSLNVQGQVVDAISGRPISGASVNVSAWVRDGRNSKNEPMGDTQTDSNGLFAVPGRRSSRHRVMIVHDDQVFGLMDGNYKYSYNQNVRTNEQTIFFTDRSIYRPGQAIQFKGVCISSNTKTNAYRALPKKSLTVVLKDVNNQVVERRKLVSNAYGSVSGSFTAPRDRATGAMRLEVEGGPTGVGTFRVEEYKRPKFFVEVAPPQEASRLNGRVKVTGVATAYTGATIDNAQVTWRVVRRVRYPDWWTWRCWWCPPNSGEAEEIAHGTTQTGADGDFTIEFLARPDLSVDRESEPVFTYAITADVTDTAGETRSSSTDVRIGYTALQAELKANEWQTVSKPVNVNVVTSTLDREGQAATGTIRIYRLRPPENVQRASLNDSRNQYGGMAAPTNDGVPDLSKINAWPLGEQFLEEEIMTSAAGKADRQFELPAGAFRVHYETRDSAGQLVKAELPLVVLDPEAQRFEVKIPHHFSAPNWTVEVGQTFEALWGTGYATGRAFIEIEHRGNVIRSFWTDANNTQALIQQDVSENMRGGFFVRATYIRENRAYVESRKVAVPWNNKDLTIQWEHFVSKLQPGSRETWTAVIRGPDAETAAAEMVATMYDASLDAFSPHSWPNRFSVFYQDNAYRVLQFQNTMRGQFLVHNLRADSKNGSMLYRYFQSDVAPSIGQHWGRFSRGRRGGIGGGIMRSAVANSAMDFALPAASAEGGEVMMDEMSAAPVMEALGQQRGQDKAGADVDLSQVSIRKNLNETAFFFPHLVAGDDGSVRIEFEIPEALTEWKLLGFAHDRNLRTALLSDTMQTSKDLMVQPNPPRFLREGDVLEFSVKVLNQSERSQAGSVKLTFSDGRTDESMDIALSNDNLVQSFEIPAGQSESLFWKITVPDFVGVLTYEAVAATEKMSDGEEGFLPVLSKRILVTESLPLPIRGEQTKQFDFAGMAKMETSDSLRSQSLTVQMTSNPAWYAVMALPYLMEYPHQCSEQVFNRLYANALGQHIAESDPKIRRVFEQWRGTDALDSPLEKNEDLRNVLIAESPWLKAAKKESQARRDVGILFDKNRLDAEVRSAFSKLAQMQYSDGAWPWFPGGRANDFITLYVTTGFGRLRHLGVTVDVAPAIKSLDRLDNWVHETYQRIEPKDRKLNHLSPTICLYLYGRSFFLKDKPVDAKYKEAVKYFQEQGAEYWPKLGSRQSQGQLAIALKRFGDRETPQAIMASLTERALSDEEMGMYWREGQESWWWYRAPIETQAIMIEAYDEVVDQQDRVEDCKVWLLKQKQTQNWKTTKATADAIYALLLRGSNLLASDQLVEVSLGDVAIQPENVEAGTGFYQQRFVRGEIKSSFAQIKVTKQDPGVAWGSVHWQYLEDVGKIEPYEGTPLTLKKALFVKNNTSSGPVIEPVSGAVNVGDELVTRVELRVDRDMEYVHLKDYRGSGTEPVNVLSRYKFQDGLAYYQSTKDTASHFFIDYLPRGTYVFEYSVRVQHRGTYQTGIAELQCMYAPEFNSHSGSIAIEVQ